MTQFDRFMLSIILLCIIGLQVITAHNAIAVKEWADGQTSCD